MSGIAKAITEIIKTADDALMAAITAADAGNFGTCEKHRQIASDATEHARVLLLATATPNQPNGEKE